MAPELRLDARIPEHGFSDPDEALDAFLGWAADSGFSLYPHQESAILEIFAGNHVVLDTPTGSGKSLVALALHFKTFCDLGRTWYTAPIKALVSEKFFALCRLFGAEHVGMMTGDGAVNRDAPILCCTAEILANLALREGPDAKVDSVVMDEFHYYADRDRGMAWQIPLLTLPKTTFLLMSATLGDTTAIREDLELRTGRPVTPVTSARRPVPLEYAYSLKPIHEALSELLRQGRAPVYVVHFTQQAAHEQAQALTSIELCTKEQKKAIAEAVRGFRFDSPFGMTLRRYVLHGVGLHHAGLLPRYRLLVEKLAQRGLLKIICGTDTLGVGINVPIRTVLFTQLCKFDGEKTEILRVRDFKQIAGRAGRAGFDDVGYVVAQAPEHIIENAMLDAKVMDAKKKKKVVRAKPPDRGYKHWDEETFRRLIDRPPEPLESRFSVDHGRLLTMMQHADEVSRDAGAGYRALLDLIDQSHSTAAQRQALKDQASALLEHLELTGIVTQESDRLRLDPTLQHDFSLHHALSVFLLDALAQVEPSSPTHALDLITWVEAILENPRQVLIRQSDRARGEVINALKAAGVPYEERMEALEKISWPKPNAEAIYEFFNGYAARHPWVGQESIRPKSVLREMVETGASFADYVKDLGLQRSEGVLLRYLSEGYKAIVQNVPAEHHTDDLLDAIAYLRAMLGRVDASLVTEWEELLAGAVAPGVEPEHPVDISQDKRRFLARVRAEMHAIVRALSRQDWEEAAAAIRRDEDDPWDADEIARALAPFLEEHGAVSYDARARQAGLTTLRADGPHQWLVRQVLLAPLGDAAYGDATDYGVDPDHEADEPLPWAIEGRIDLRADTNPEGPLVVLLRIGE